MYVSICAQRWSASTNLCFVCVAAFGVENVLQDDGLHVYRTAKTSNQNVIVRHVNYGTVMYPRTVSIHVPTEKMMATNGPRYGVARNTGQGLVFVLDHPSEAERLERYGAWTRADWLKFVNEKKASGAGYARDEPIGWFDFEKEDAVLASVAAAAQADSKDSKDAKAAEPKKDEKGLFVPLLMVV